MTMKRQPPNGAALDHVRDLISHASTALRERGHDGTIHEEEITCLLAPDRAAEALEMLDDWEARLGLPALLRMRLADWVIQYGNPDVVAFYFAADPSANPMLDCGHVLPAEYRMPGYTGGSGYAIHDGRRICYACAAEVTREEMIKNGRATLYLTDGDGAITDWPAQLRFAVLPGTLRYSSGRGFGGKYQITSGRFVGPDGKVWAFRNAGDNDVARCHRLARQRKGGAS